MGLDTTHNAFHGAYSAFQRFRKAVANAAGVSYPPHADPTLDPHSWYWLDKSDADKHPGLTAFFSSDDCTGSFSPDLCSLMAAELEVLLPKVRELERPEEDWGHIQRDGGMARVLERYILGCRLAAQENECLEYH